LNVENEQPVEIYHHPQRLGYANQSLSGSVMLHILIEPMLQHLGRR
jgi:hypothetical protein